MRRHRCPKCGYQLPTHLKACDFWRSPVTLGIIEAWLEREVAKGMRTFGIWRT